MTPEPELPPLAEPKVPITCSKCGAKHDTKLTKTGAPRIPRQWKVIIGKTYCPKCKKAGYVLRAVTIPVAHCDWEVIRPLLRTTWRDGVHCANWLLTEYYHQDTLADDAGKKVPPWKAPYLYPRLRVKFPLLEPSVLVSIINTVSAKYRASRFDLWRGAVSLPIYRDMPMMVSSQNWILVEEKGERIFSVRINSERHLFRLRRDHQFRRQLRSLDSIIAGDVEAGEAALYQRKDEKKKPVLMLKIAGWFERAERQPDGCVVKARTCEDGFLVAVDGEAIWRLNADHVKSWIAGAAVRQQRLREDLKAERRFPVRMREGIVERMGKLSELRRNQLNSWMHASSLQLVNWARRRRASTLVWDDSYRSSFPSFPWFIFAAKISEKCALAGIEFVKANEEAAPNTPPPLADSGEEANETLNSPAPSVPKP